MKITFCGTSAQAWDLAAVLGSEGLDVEVEERVTESVGVTDVAGDCASTVAPASARASQTSAG